MIDVDQIDSEPRIKTHFFRASAADFRKVPGSPIAYWVSEAVHQSFQNGTPFGDVSTPKQGLATGCNDLFIRQWHEVPFNGIGLGTRSRLDAKKSGLRWFPYNKGGEWRKWYGNYDYVVDWQDDGQRIREFKDENGKVRSRPQNTEYYFHEGITWSYITTNAFAARYAPPGFIFDVKGSSGFPKSADIFPVFGLMNSKLMQDFMGILNPTSTFQVGDMARVPFLDLGVKTQIVGSNVRNLIAFGRADWDSFEVSRDFIGPSMLDHKNRLDDLSATYQRVNTCQQEIVLATQRLEQQNNRIFIEAYGLQDELTPDVPLKEITLTCNPHYRYGSDKSKEELEALLLADTMREFCSYAVGCMFGRYSLDKPGLVLANQGETLEDYLAQVPEPTFLPDKDNVIPMLDGDWFPDDVTERFCDFLRVTFGKEHYEENLAFVEHGLNIKGKRNYSVRDFFVREFYDYHVKLYKKRPIYWLFASPKGTFQTLVYLHRYRSDTVSVVLGYLRDFRTKLEARQGQLQRRVIDPDISQGEKTRMDKELDKLGKQLLELNDYERDVLHPLASQRLEIDLDDGVKANYPKFGAALKKISGLEAKGD